MKTEHAVVLTDTFRPDRVRLECTCGWTAEARSGEEAERLRSEHEASTS